MSNRKWSVMTHSLVLVSLPPPAAVILYPPLNLLWFQHTCRSSCRAQPVHCEIMGLIKILLQGTTLFYLPFQLTTSESYFTLPALCIHSVQQYSLHNAALSLCFVHEQLPEGSKQTLTWLTYVMIKVAPLLRFQLEFIEKALFKYDEAFGSWGSFSKLDNSNCCLFARGQP